MTAFLAGTAPVLTAHLTPNTIRALDFPGSFRTIHGKTYSLYQRSGCRRRSISSLGRAPTMLLIISPFLKRSMVGMLLIE